MPSQVIRFDALRSLGFASISGTYAAVGGAFTHQVRLLKFVNLTDANLTVSFDGTTDNDIIPANGFALYDGTTNKVSSEATFVFQPGTQILVKGSPTSGSFYVIALFGRGE